jgi:DNA-binding MarR family transcriptional regulator
MSCVKIAQYLVLEAIKAGKTPEEIARLLDLEPHDVYAVIRLLEEGGLVKRRPDLFGERYVLTETGRRELEEWRREVLERAEEATRLRREGRGREAQSLIGQLLPALPVLAVLGVLSFAIWRLLTSHLSVGEDK